MRFVSFLLRYRHKICYNVLWMAFLVVTVRKIRFLSYEKLIADFKRSYIRERNNIYIFATQYERVCNAHTPHNLIYTNRVLTASQRITRLVPSFRYIVMDLATHYAALPPTLQ